MKAKQKLEHSHLIKQAVDSVLFASDGKKGAIPSK
jgi:hypothetical protein